MPKLLEDFKGKAVFLVGCRAKDSGFEWCYYDVAVYPHEGKKFFLDGSKRVVVIPVSRPQSFPRSSTKLLNDYNFYYAQAVSDDSKYFRGAAKAALTRSADYLLALPRLGQLAVKLAVVNAARALLMIKGVEPSPSHLYDQLAEAGGGLATRAIGILELAEDLGLLSHRGIIVENMLGGVDAEIFRSKLSELMKRWPIKASLYMLSVLDTVGKERLADALHELKFGSAGERESKEALSLLKEVAAML